MLHVLQPLAIHLRDLAPVVFFFTSTRGESSCTNHQFGSMHPGQFEGKSWMRMWFAVSPRWDRFEVLCNTHYYTVNTVNTEGVSQEVLIVGLEVRSSSDSWKVQALPDFIVGGGSGPRSGSTRTFNHRAGSLRISNQGLSKKCTWHGKATCEVLNHAM